MKTKSKMVRIPVRVLKKINKLKTYSNETIWRIIERLYNKYEENRK